MPKVIGIIPARYASTRLPGKMLRDLYGKPLIQRVYENATQASALSEVIVATDHQAIKDVIQAAGGRAVMTSENLASGTDRIATVAQTIDADVVVNIQGDEPFLHPEDINTVANLILDHKEAVAGTLIKKISKTEELRDPNIVKVTVRQNHQALYFSRHPIPYARDAKNDAEWMSCATYFKHIGIYSYRKSFLLEYASWPPSSLELAEKLEQLRILEHGYSIHVAETEHEPMGIDTEADLQMAIQRIQNQLMKG